MENKPSILLLVPTHHDFDSSGIPFEEKMLQWIILTPSKKEFDKTLSTIYGRVFEALTKIHPFEAKISMGVSVEEKRLLHPKRVWGKIYFNNECIITFSHYTRIHDRPFYSIISWPEMDNFPHSTGKELSDNIDKIIDILFLWSVDQWTEFFKQRIMTMANELKTKALEKRNGALVLENNADVLLLALQDKK